MPCLNEAETLAICIRKAKKALATESIQGEVLIADNGSTDGSREIALAEGARVIEVAEKGYGNALRAGIRAARGPWILMGDADDSYDFSQIGEFISRLSSGVELVMGCRMPSGGGIVLKGAMPWKHRWLGNPVLTYIGRLFFGCPVHDFHCGMRAFTKDAYEKFQMGTTGMEFASEMVIKATLCGVCIGEVPITLHPDGRSRPPHLRSWRDGWRHLRFMLLFSPRWLFLIPAAIFMGIGALGLGILSMGQMLFGRMVLDVGTMIGCSMLLLIGIQLFWLAVFTRAFAVSEGLLPPHTRLKSLLERVPMEVGLLGGVVFLSLGLLLFSTAFLDWQKAGFRDLSYGENLRRIIPATTLVVVGIQAIFGSFFLGVLGFKATLRTDPYPP